MIGLNTIRTYIVQNGPRFIKERMKHEQEMDRCRHEFKTYLSMDAIISPNVPEEDYGKFLTKLETSLKAHGTNARIGDFNAKFHMWGIREKKVTPWRNGFFRRDCKW